MRGRAEEQGRRVENALTGVRSTKERRLRVLFFDHTALMSGGEIALLHLVEHLDKSAMEPVVLLGEEGPLARRFGSEVEVHVLALEGSVAETRKDALGSASLLRVGAVWGSARYVVKLARFIRRRGIDMVHTNSLKADLLGGMAARLARVPVIWHVRDRIASDYLPKKVVSAFLWLSGVLPTAMIANSHATAATLKRRGGRQTPVYVVHDGTPMRSFRYGARPQAGVVGIVGRISPWKGQDVFLRAASRIRKSYPEARFRVIGSALFAEVEFEASLHELTDELGLRDVVEFRGFQEDVPSEIAQMAVFVHASTKPEPFGQVIIEAMAAGVPVVATLGGGVAEIVEDGVTGLLVGSRDPEALAAAVCRLLRDPAQAGEMAERGREAVKERFLVERTAREVERVMEAVAEEHLGGAFRRPVGAVVRASDL